MVTPVPIVYIPYSHLRPEFILHLKHTLELLKTISNWNITWWMDGKLCMMTGHHKIHHLWIFERWFILSWCSIHAWSNTSPTSWRGLIVKRGPFEFPPKFTPTISISQINIPKPRADSFFCVFCCSGERSVPDFLPSLISAFSLIFSAFCSEGSCANYS